MIKQKKIRYYLDVNDRTIYLRELGSKEKRSSFLHLTQPSDKPPILLLVGPPDRDKTSLAKSVAVAFPHLAWKCA